MAKEEPYLAMILFLTAFVTYPSGLFRQYKKCAQRLDSNPKYVSNLVSLHPLNMMVTSRSNARDVPNDIQFCAKCAAPLAFNVPPGDERERLVCTSPDCGLVVYQNPKTTVASVTITHDRQHVLLARRKIQPAVGKWNLVGG